MVKNALFILLILTSHLALADSEISTIRIFDTSSQEGGLESFGFGDLPVENLPTSSARVSSQTITQNGLHRLSDVTLIDASTTDSYNATGYWDYLSIRGFTLDNRYNYQREGLPITAETSIGLENKERVEILKGLGGLQSGAGSPGGFVNYVVKRPTNKPTKELRTEVSEKGNLLTAVDVGGRFSGAEEYGYRINLAHEKLEPHLKKTSGNRSLVALAADWRVTEQSYLEAEVEWSQRSQPSQAGFSLLGNKLPEPSRPDLNLNNQPWTEPVEFLGLTGSVRLTQAFNSSWTWSLAAGAQDLTTNDRLAYPYGCSAENKYDRYCSNGTYDLYDFRSDDESRKTYAAKASLQGKVTTGDITHQLYLGVLSTSSRERFQKQAYNYAGVGNVEGTAIGTANPTLNDENTNRDSASHELSLADSAKFKKWTGWLGLRFTNLHRSSIRTDGSRSTDYSQNFLIPWTALSYEFENILAYASIGQGLESFVTPNKDGYTRRGEFLPDVISRQYELGLRSDMRDLGWSLAFFQIQRPVVVDQKPTYQIDGEAQHQGAEAQGYLNKGPWGLTASFMKLNAERKDSSLNSSLNGKRPVNVPEDAVRIGVSYQLSAIKGLTLHTRLSHEGTRAVLSDNSIMLPAWTRGDVGASYTQNWEKTKLLWRLTVTNLTDERYWKESPTQYGHIYLYPGEERSLLLSLQAQL